jgi:hypothetical protein
MLWDAVASEMQVARHGANGSRRRYETGFVLSLTIFPLNTTRRTRSMA